MHNPMADLTPAASGAEPRRGACTLRVSPRFLAHAEETAARLFHQARFLGVTHALEAALSPGTATTTPSGRRPLPHRLPRRARAVRRPPPRVPGAGAVHRRGLMRRRPDSINKARIQDSVTAAYLSDGNHRYVTDVELGNQRLRYLQAVFDWWKSRGQWPRQKVIARLLAADFDAEQLTREWSWPWIEFPSSDGNLVKLRLAGFWKCHGGESMADSFLAALQVALRRYFDHETVPELDASRLAEEAHISLKQAALGMELFANESICSATRGGDPSMLVIELDNNLLPYRGVKSMEDYLRIRHEERGTPMDLSLKKIAVQPAMSLRKRPKLPAQYCIHHHAHQPWRCRDVGGASDN